MSSSIKHEKRGGARPGARQVTHKTLKLITTRLSYVFRNDETRQIYVEDVECRDCLEQSRALAYKLRKRGETRTPIIINDYPLCDTTVVFTMDVHEFINTVHRYRETVTAEYEDVPDKIPHLNPAPAVECPDGDCLQEAERIEELCLEAE